MKRPNCLSIAGSDPSGGAGVQADLRTFAALGCHGMAVVAALTAQNSLGVRATHVPPAEFLGAQIDAVLDDVDVAAIKIGMLGDAANVAAVARRLRARALKFVVLDPVLAASSGDALAGGDVAGAIVRELLPLVDLATPNVAEAARLCGDAEACDVEGRRRQARALMARGAKAVLMKGGHVAGDESVDLLFDGEGELALSAPRVATRNTRGTGCTLSSAIAAHMALGLALRDAVAAAKDFLTGALRGDDLHVGAGPQPLDHFWQHRTKP